MWLHGAAVQDDMDNTANAIGRPMGWEVEQTERFSASDTCSLLLGIPEMQRHHCSTQSGRR